MTREELERILGKSGTSSRVFLTHSGVQMSLKENNFIGEFLKEGDLVVAAKNAGYKPTIEDDAHYKAIAKRVLAKDYIYDELLYRIEELNKESIADANEIMGYFTKVMRGEEKDQFGLDAPLSERTAAARELAKRLIDMPNKASEAERAIKIELDWKRPNAE